MQTVILEIEIAPMQDELTTPLDYFQDDLKEFFEQFGWKIVAIDGEEE